MDWMQGSQVRVLGLRGVLLIFLIFCESSPVCESVTCPDPPPVSAGVVHISGHGNSEGTIRLYGCKQGYVRNRMRSEYRVCQENGNWTGDESEPLCRKALDSSSEEESQRGETAPTNVTAVPANGTVTQNGRPGRGKIEKSKGTPVWLYAGVPAAVVFLVVIVVVVYVVCFKRKRGAGRTRLPNSEEEADGRRDALTNRQQSEGSKLRPGPRQPVASSRRERDGKENGEKPVAQARRSRLKQYAASIASEKREQAASSAEKTSGRRESLLERSKLTIKKVFRPRQDAVSLRKQAVNGSIRLNNSQSCEAIAADQEASEASSGNGPTPMPKVRAGSASMKAKSSIPILMDDASVYVNVHELEKVMSANQPEIVVQNDALESAAETIVLTEPDTSEVTIKPEVDADVKESTA